VSVLEHPRWRARTWRCTATRASGKHLPAPVTLPVAGGRAATVVSMVQPVGDRAPTVEIRIRIHLAAGSQARQIRMVLRLLAGLNTAVAQVTR
jgi:hypothetical protein